ncbi:ricin-type beta-trefoil lectin domain protein [Undibacterium sp. SXout7W]|uniref:ricin-type beta-trefoil lectin domain protein n=1 Tax=Undibacterium sp. SXout7W TaxID=3413049 RepID=UPI003BF06B15
MSFVYYIENIAGGVVTAAQTMANAQLAVLNQAGSSDLQLWRFTNEGYFVLNSSSPELCLSVVQDSLQNGSLVTLAPKGAQNYLQTWVYNTAKNGFSLVANSNYFLTSGLGGSGGPVVYVSTESNTPLTQWRLGFDWALEQQFYFSDGADIDRTVWQSPQWISSNNNPSFFGQTSIRNPADFSPPIGYVPVVNNTAQLCLSTFNPLAAAQGNPDFLGAQIGTINQWGLPSYDAVAFEANVVLPQTAPGGVVASLFAYNLIQQAPFLHDEIDFELSSNYWGDSQPQINTNVYVVTGQSMPNYDHVVTSQIGLTGTVTLRIEWSQAGVSWYINKDQNPAPIYTETNVPQTDMSLVLNFWVPDSGWNWAYDSSLVPAANQPGQQWEYQVNWAKVWVVKKQASSC